MIVPMSARAARPGNHNRPSYRRARPLSRLSPRPVSIGHLCKSRLIIFNQIRPRRCADDRRDALTLARGPAGRANNYGRQFPQLVDAVARFFTIYSTLVSINETRKASFRLPVVDDFALRRRSFYIVDLVDIFFQIGIISRSVVHSLYVRCLISQDFMRLQVIVARKVLRARKMFPRNTYVYIWRNVENVNFRFYYKNMNLMNIIL